jgi:uncharacterized protein
VEVLRRYQPSRVLPSVPYLPGRSERPVVDEGRAKPGAPHVPAERWAEHAEYLWGADLYNAGFFWEAHEAWEAAWRAAERDVVQHAFLQGLIQVAAACLKGVLGDADAARRIAARALQRLERTQTDAGTPFMGLDLAPFSGAFRSFIDRDPTHLAERPALILGAPS